MPAWVIALANQKGGVAKTATTFNLGAELAKTGRRVLLVDLDPQASLTAILGIDATENNLADVLGTSDRGTGNLAPIIRPIGEGLDLAPGDIALSQTEMGLVVRRAREIQLARALAPVADRYQVILIDSPPSLGTLTLNALTAAHHVIVPVVLDALALRGLSLFLGTLAEVREDFGQAAGLLGVLPTLVDLRPTHSRDVLEALRGRADLRLFETIIPRTIRVSEAALLRQSIGEYMPDHPTAEAYANLAQEVLKRGQ